jgi:hypothetical protein
MITSIFNHDFIKAFIHSLQFLAAIAATLYYYKYKDTFLKYIIFFIWYTAINELAARLLVNALHGNNIILYNVYYILNFTYSILLYRSALSKQKNKRLMVPLLVIYLVSVAVMCFFFSFRYDFFTFTYAEGALFVIAGITLYFSEILRSDKIIHINKNLLFWISTGWLIFYVASIPFFLMRQYYARLSFISISMYLIYFLNFVLYSIFIIGFIWSGREQKSLLQP